MRSRLNAVDLFCGCGGASLGVQMTGHRVVAAVDVDGVACSWYARNLELEPLCADLRTIDGLSVLDHFGLKHDEVDLVVGCPPCQGFSSLRRTTYPEGTDERNGLVEVFLRRVEELRPRIVVFENVSGMVRGGGARYLQLLKLKLKTAGYSFNEDFLVDAADYGVPQHRKRVVLVAVKDARGRPSLPTKTRFDPATGGEGEGPWKTVRSAISDLPPLGAGEAGRSIPNHVARKHTPAVMRLIKSLPKDGGSRKDLPRDLWLPCHLKLNGRGAESVYGRMRWDAPSPTITCRCTTPSSGRFVHPEQDRAITVREAARLQTFPDWFVFPNESKAAERLVGNAVPPELIAAIVDHLARSLES